MVTCESICKYFEFTFTSESQIVLFGSPFGEQLAPSCNMPHCVTQQKIKLFFFGDQNSLPDDLLTTVGHQKATYTKIELGAL